MSETVLICAAAFFRSKGKNVVTESEFLMDLSMTKRWMPYGEAERFLAVAVRDGVLTKDGEYIRPGFDVGNVDVPVGYRPTSELISNICSADPKAETVPDAVPDVFPELVSKAAALDLDRKDFMSMCRSLQKKMNIEIEVAAVMVLRDRGADISGFVERVYREVKGR